MQLFVRALGPCSHAVSVAHGDTVLELKQAIQAATGIPAAEQVLTYCGRPLCDNMAQLHAMRSLDGAPLAAGSSVSCALRLAGGKGGFGALLRGQGRDGKITDNFDSCRDLSGRRVGSVEAEKKLKEWEAQAQQRQLLKMQEKEARQLERLAAKEAAQQVNVEEVKEKQQSALQAVQQAVESALAEALASSGNASTSNTRSAGAAAAAEEASDAKAGTKRKSPGGENPVVAPPAKRPSMLAALEGSDDDDEGSDSE